MTDLIIDPEFVELLTVFPPLQFVDPMAQRATLAEVRRASSPSSLPEDVVVERAVVDEAGIAVPVHRFRPQELPERAPVLIWMHGGGYCIGTPDEDAGLCAWLARKLGALVVSVDYRLAPEHPYPAGLDDCCAVVRAVSAQFPESRIAIGGASAGAGLAAAVTLRARSGDCPMPDAQLLIMPFLDARLSSASMHELAEAPVFTAKDAADCWRHYLGDRVGDPPADGSPSAAADLAGLPPAYVAVAGTDCLRDEAIDYALRLQAAGVPAELHVVPGVPHGFTGLLPGSTAARRIRTELAAVASRLLEEQT
ncbi:alpha/beta hydrolase [Pseudonocardia lutea]|uniref:Alpha/beta hydrolase n=1 Tax=Pseudonocardia lutea TaxID=2172015 RepID=A0ABW1IDW1_9PSEU